jgi:protein Tex
MSATDASLSTPTTQALLPSIESRIAAEISARESQVIAAVALLDEGATVPFIARYRKEVTSGLDDSQLRLLEERLAYLRELEERRKAILNSIAEQGKLTASLQHDVLSADTKARLEDLYLPYKPKRRTKAMIAREAGLEPLALSLLDDPTHVPEQLAASYVDAERGVADTKAALDGARAILLERVSESAELVGALRTWLFEHGQIRSKVIAGKEKEGAKYADYFDMVEPIKQIPSHRTLALFRARSEGILDLDLEPGANPEAQHAIATGKVARALGVEAKNRAADAWLLETCRQAWLTKLHVHLTLDLYGQIRERAEAEAIRVFGDNLKDLLLAAPAGPRVVMGLDPGMRTGVKLAIVDATGKVLYTGVIYPHAPQNQWDQALIALKTLSERFHVSLVSIGNGTASRETDQLVSELMRKHAELKLAKVVVSEAGASVYSASELAAKEFPELDVTLRGAVSIARRLQDPLAELVKIDPKSIGVGQYQHDVNQVKLGQRLDATVEDCVNGVGVDLNTASSPLLARVAGLSTGLAENIVKYREANGAFRTRTQLKEVSRLGMRAYEQCAGFLRISSGVNPLDASAVHPEAYPVVERIIEFTGKDIDRLIGDLPTLRALDPSAFVDERFGEPTVRDIFKELEKPGRDPRPEFKTANFAEGITDVKHLKPGMILEGVVSNVAAFGAFVDLGVHQDGLVHISQLSGNKFVTDPRDVVKAGQIVKVKVLEVDLDRKRVSLTMRLDEPTEAKPSSPRPPRRENTERAKPPLAKPASPVKDNRPKHEINRAAAQKPLPVKSAAGAQFAAKNAGQKPQQGTAVDRGARASQDKNFSRPHERSGDRARGAASAFQKPAPATSKLGGLFDDAFAKLKK